MSTARILILTPYYLPGYRAGGPIRSLANLTQALGEEYRFSVVAYGRDLGDREHYSGVPLSRWLRLGRAEVYYVPIGPMLPIEIMGIVSREACDVLYFSSIFEPLFTILPLLLRRAGIVRRPVTVVAPRGSLLEPALRSKQRKKRAFLRAAKALGLYDGIRWHATSAAEAEAIKSLFGSSTTRPSEIVIANNLVAASASVCGEQVGPSKTPGRLRLAYVGRISRVKNLDFALRCLSEVRDAIIQYTVYGPLEDAQYWFECQALAAALPSGISVVYEGPRDPETLGGLLAGHHALFLPTTTENFGHSIIEALRAGLPAIVSDRTPWRGLERAGAGWDLPLEEPQRFVDALRTLVAADAGSLRQMSAHARAYGQSVARTEAELDAYRSLFRPRTRGGESSDRGASALAAGSR